MPVALPPRGQNGGEAIAGFPMFPRETVITTFARQSVIVTNCRVRSYADGAGTSSLTSIFLEHVVSCSVIALRKPWLLVIAVVVQLASLAMATRGGTGWITGVLVGVAFGVAYFATMRNVVAISSAGAVIRIDVGGADTGAIHDLIQTIEAAKDARYRRDVA